MLTLRQWRWEVALLMAHAGNGWRAAPYFYEPMTEPVERLAMLRKVAHPPERP